MPIFIPIIAGIAGLFGGSVLNTAVSKPTVVQQTPESNLVRYAAYGIGIYVLWRVGKKFL